MTETDLPKRTPATFWNPETGEIEYNQHLPSDFEADGPLKVYWGHIDGAGFYIDPETEQPKPKPAVWPVIEDYIVKGLPPKAKVYVNEHYGEIEGGEFRMYPMSGMPQHVDLTIEAVNHRRFQKVITLSGAYETWDGPAFSLVQDYALLRRQKDIGYPSIDEQLGALWKIVEVLLNHSPALKAFIPEDALAVLDKVRETKRKFPKE